MHNMNFLRMGPHGMQGTAYGAGRYPFPHGMGGSPLVGMGGGPLGMVGCGMGMGRGPSAMGDGGGMGMGCGFGGGANMRFVHGGVGNGMGMGMGYGGSMAHGWWDPMMNLEDDEEQDDDEDEAFWDEEENSDVFTSYLKGQRGKRKGQGFGGMLFHVSCVCSSC